MSLRFKKLCCSEAVKKTNRKVRRECAKDAKNKYYLKKLYYLNILSELCDTFAIFA